MASLTQTTSRALGWNYAGSFTRLAIAFGVNILLTRLLGPRPFGEIAVALLLFGIGNLISGIGITSALIQKENLDNRDIRFCFTAQMLVGMSMSVVLFLSAPLWASFFRVSELTHMLRILSPLFVLQSSGTTAIALLNRDQNTRAIQLASVSSYLLAFLGCAVPMALLGYGVWSLVMAYLVQACTNAILAYAQRRHTLLPLLHRGGVPLVRFGLAVLGANLSNWGISNLDNTVVGRVSGPSALGFYSRAFTLASLPAENIIGNLLPVLLPAYSRVQYDTKKLGRIYAAAFGIVALILFPPFCAMACVPSVIVLGLYGAKWSPAIDFFQPLALAIPLNAVMALTGPLLASRGKPHIEMRLQLIVVLVAGFAYSISVQHSVLALSWTVLGVYVLRFLLLTRSALREIGCTSKELVRNAWTAVVPVAVACISATAANLWIPVHAYWIRLIVVAGCSGASTLLCLYSARGLLILPILRGVPEIERLLQDQMLRFGVLIGARR